MIRVGKLNISKSSGEILQLNMQLSDMLNNRVADFSHLDDLFTLETGGSLYQYLLQNHDRYPWHAVKVYSAFSADKSDFICIFDTQKSGIQTDVELIFAPLAEEVDKTSQKTHFPPLFDSITDFFLVCDEEFTIISANKAAKAVYSGTEDLIGQKCYAALRGKKSPCAGCPLPQTLSSGRVVPVEFYESDLREFLELRTYPNFDDAGNYQGFTLLKRIVSKRRAQEDETAQSKKLQALGQMASGVAHDFNNMLTIILGRIQLLKSKASDQASLSNLQTMEKAALDSTDIIQRLQDFTRKRFQAESANFSLLNINLVIEDVVSYASTRIEKLKRQHGIRIDIEHNLEATEKVEGNESQLRSAILNIIFNSIAALEIGGVINIWTHQIGSQIEIGISDTGVGMPDDVKEKIFDPFFSTKGDEGNGLGLSEVYGIINHHNGRIKVESTFGEGTTMLLYLPSSGRN